MASDPHQPGPNYVAATSSRSAAGSTAAADTGSNFIKRAKNCPARAERAQSRRTLHTRVFGPGNSDQSRPSSSQTAYNARLKDLARSSERNFHLPPFVMD
jgi:hypothetical protein